MKRDGSIFAGYLSGFESVDHLLFDNSNFSFGVQCILSSQFFTQDFKSEFFPSRDIKHNKLHRQLNGLVFVSDEMWLNALSWKVFNDSDSGNPQLNEKLFSSFKIQLTPVEITLDIIRKGFLFKHDLFPEEIPKVAFGKEENLQRLIQLCSQNPKNIPALYQLQKSLPNFFPNFLALLDLKNIDLLKLSEEEKALVQVYRLSRGKEEAEVLNLIHGEQYEKARQFFDSTDVLSHSMNLQFCYNLMKNLN